MMLKINVWELFIEERVMLRINLMQLANFVAQKLGQGLRRIKRDKPVC